MGEKEKTSKAETSLLEPKTEGTLEELQAF
jgi:hypothetical protein